MKRIFFLVAIGMLQIVVGSVMTYGAAEPIRFSQSVVVGPADLVFHFPFGILGAGRVVGNLTVQQAQSVDFKVFDDRGYAAFVANTNAVPPVYSKSGVNFTVSANLSSAGTYHVVIEGPGGQQQLIVRLQMVLSGLKTNETILALVVLVGGLALVGASLMLSVWSWRHPRPVPTGSSAPPIDPSSDPLNNPFNSPSNTPSNPPPSTSPDPSKDDTRIW